MMNVIFCKIKKASGVRFLIDIRHQSMNGRRAVIFPRLRSGSSHSSVDKLLHIMLPGISINWLSFSDDHHVQEAHAKVRHLLDAYV